PVPGDYAGQLTECRTCRVRLEFSVSLDLEVVSCVFWLRYAGMRNYMCFAQKRKPSVWDMGKK
ncbi:MAG TPA: hypothetical protein PKE58_12535, partial [Acidobacteriota bacterium]|nr:hypothetical protein [Acidobacteriota bacterium]